MEKVQSLQQAVGRRPNGTAKIVIGMDNHSVPIMKVWEMRITMGYTAPSTAEGLAGKGQMGRNR